MYISVFTTGPGGKKPLYLIIVFSLQEFSRLPITTGVGEVRGK
ncbi:hypothetical protein FHS09_003246 [Microbulbifer rhizosphaerae]|uniref:Uncharacterized protein n=1 Tax=Microbulbifer rhizosphaerae TaxID=1562603 RepID=A0A7W4ZA55_9GAMM|nr:hypothetical protein [Microbulbifer rhizosphaerae]